MENNSSYLKFLINEDIYNIQEDVSSDMDTNESPEPDKPHFSNETYILIDIKEKDFTDESSNILLEKILNAIGLTSDLVKFIYPSDVSIIQNSEFENCTFISFYDLIPDFLPDNEVSEKYHLYSMDSNSWLLSDSLETLNSSRDKKILLWNNLKILFKLN